MSRLILPRFQSLDKPINDLKNKKKFQNLKSTRNKKNLLKLKYLFRHFQGKNKSTEYKLHSLNETMGHKI